MKSQQNNQSGFSAVELLITLFIGAIFLLAANQLYTVVVKSGGESYTYSIASQDAQTWARRTINDSKNSTSDDNCASLPSPSTTTSSDVTRTVTISCPNSTNFPNLRKVTVLSTYRSKGVTHGVYYNAS